VIGERATPVLLIFLPRPRPRPRPRHGKTLARPRHHLLLPADAALAMAPPPRHGPATSTAVRAPKPSCRHPHRLTDLSPPDPFSSKLARVGEEGGGAGAGACDGEEHCGWWDPRVMEWRRRTVRATEGDRGGGHAVAEKNGRPC